MESSELKKIEELRRKLYKLNYQEMGVAINSRDNNRQGDPAELAKFEDIQQRRQEISDILDVYETRYLIRRAERLGIEVPYKEEWYTHQDSNSEVGRVTGEKPKKVINEALTEVGKAVINRQIRTERFEYWRGWSQIIIPILSLIVAIIALLKR